MLKGLGATVALPMLDAMMPAGASAQTGRKPIRLIAMEMVHGAAGSTAYGIRQHMWSPAQTSDAFDLTPMSLKSLEPYRDYLTIGSNTDVRNAEAFAASEIGADHFLVHHKVGPVTPDWAKGVPVAQIGDHTFYRGKRKL